MTHGVVVMAELMTVQEVMDYLKVSRNQVYAWCRDGTLKYAKLSSRVLRIYATSVDAFVARMTV